MKRLIAVLICLLLICAVAVGGYADGVGSPSSAYWTNVNSTNQGYNQQQQSQSMMGQGYGYGEGGRATAEGGDATAGAVAVSGDATSGSIASISTTSISNYRQRTPPLSVYPPYLPLWQHGGWGSIKAYFPTGPNNDDQVYQRTFDPADPDDVRELRGVLESLPYGGPLDVLGGILNGVAVVLGGPDNFHHGRGFEIANSLIRDRRPEQKALIVFIDTNVDRQLLEQAGYAYVGKVSVEGEVDRNWDHVYDAAVAEVLPWDVDILLVSGGMKGVTVGSNIAFPGAAGAYSQANYSISLFGSVSSGITEGKGKALVSAEGYRYWPEAVNRRKIPKFLLERIQAKPQPSKSTGPAAQEIPAPTKKQKHAGIEVKQKLYDMAGFEEGQRVDYTIVK